MNNVLISKNLNDEIEKDDKAQDVYSLDCCNVLICKSYGNLSFSCVAGAYANTRCSLSEKMQIRILNDSNPNVTYKPEKLDVSNDD